VIGCPTGKQTYATPAEAARAVALVADRRSRHSAAARRTWLKGKLKHYRCKVCGGWHIGHAKIEGKRA
jgi:hypothetical protein